MGISVDGYGQMPGLSQQAGQQGNQDHTDQSHAAASDKLFYPELVGTIMPMAGGSVSQKIIYGILKIIPGGAGPAVTCSTSGMGFRLK